MSKDDKYQTYIEANYGEEFMEYACKDCGAKWGTSFDPKKAVFRCRRCWNALQDPDPLEVIFVPPPMGASPHTPEAYVKRISWHLRVIRDSAASIQSILKEIK